MDDLLSAATVGAYLQSRGLVDDLSSVTAKDLEWGVSNVVLAVEAPGLHVVVKQALPQLRVADEWLAKRERTVTEGEALKLAGAITPGVVPAVVDIDREACALTIEHAPPGWRNWKEELLGSGGDSRTAEQVGAALHAWHQATSGDASVAARFNDFEAFDQLRVDPYLRTVMRRRPEIADVVGRYVERMAATRTCLVHGDYSPKNVLVGDGRIWVVDFEVAHVGDPAFDIGFMLNHLMLKSIHTGRDQRACADAFLAQLNIPDAAYVLGMTGCLMLARVDGKSPAEYLSEDERQIARALGDGLVLDPPDTLADAWERLP